jgi:hypothetical protein
MSSVPWKEPNGLFKHRNKRQPLHFFTRIDNNSYFLQIPAVLSRRLDPELNFVHSRLSNLHDGVSPYQRLLLA